MCVVYGDGRGGVGSGGGSGIEGGIAPPQLLLSSQSTSNIPYISFTLISNIPHLHRVLLRLGQPVHLPLVLEGGPLLVGQPLPREQRFLVLDLLFQILQLVRLSLAQVLLPRALPQLGDQAGAGVLVLCVGW